MGSSTGVLFRVTTFGESHGPAIGAVVEGFPPGLSVDLAAVQAELDRRRPGLSDLSSPRREADRVEVLSGVFEGRALGSPIALLIRNEDADATDYARFADLYRPGHADHTTEARYGIRDWRGGGRASARETAARVAAGALAKQALAALAGVAVTGWVDQVGDVVAGCDPDAVDAEAVERSPVRCPDPDAAARMAAAIRSARDDGDTVGGVVRCVARGVPAGLGDPVFDKLEADLAAALMSIPAARGFEVGDGFRVAGMRGSACNDALAPGPDGPRSATNRAGGVNGGISNGMPVVVSVAFKPVSTLRLPQQTVSRDGAPAVLAARGRHDPCVVPRAVPIVEAGVAMVLLDHLLRLRALRGNMPV